MRKCSFVLFGAVLFCNAIFGDNRIFYIDKFSYCISADTADWSCQRVNFVNNRKGYFEHSQYISGRANNLPIEFIFYPCLADKKGHAMSFTNSLGDVSEFLKKLGEATGSQFSGLWPKSCAVATYKLFEGRYVSAAISGYFALLIQPTSSYNSVFMLVKIPGNPTDFELRDEMCEKAFALVASLRDISVSNSLIIPTNDELSEKDLSDYESKKIVELLKKYGKKPIISSIEQGDYEAALFLLDLLPDNRNYLNAVFIYAFLDEQKELSALQMALIYKLFDMGKYHVDDSMGFGGLPSGKAGVSQKSTDHTLLSFAMHFGLIDLFHRLLEAGADINARKGCLLTQAVESGNVEKVRFVLDNGARADVADLQDLVQPTSSCEIIKLLIDNGAIFDKEFLLHVFTSRADIEAVKLMLDNGADPNSSQFDLLYNAVATGNIELVKLYLDFGLKISNGYILNPAIWHLDVKMVEFLIDNGANPCDTVSPHGAEINVLDYALSRKTNSQEEEAKKDAVLNVLVKNGALCI